MNVEEAFRIVKQKYSIKFDLKSEQFEIINAVVTKQNVFGILPTGFGKSATFVLPPLILDELQPLNKPHVALVVSPLRALMHDQLQRCEEMGVRAIVMQRASDVSSRDRQESGEASIMFASPEALNDKAVAVLKNQRHRICVLAFDEVHCVSEWGENFRPDYKRVTAVRSIFDCACLALSATVTSQIFTDVKKSLHLHDCVVKAYPPDRRNIFMEVARRGTLVADRDLAWVVAGLRTTKHHFDKTLIYGRSINCVTELYAWMLGELRDDAYVTNDDGRQRMVAMYHAHLSDDLQRHIMSEFKKADSTIRVVISTVAFGIGVEIADIRQVVHWGRLSSLMTYWQEVGRAGRDGASSRAVWYCNATAAGNDSVLKQLATSNACLRKTLLEGFVIPEMDVSRLHELAARRPCDDQCQDCACDFCTCCSYCRRECICSQQHDV